MAVDTQAPTEVTHYKNYIGGEWVDASSGETFDITNPATEEVFASVPKGDREDARRAIAAARQAFDEGPWATMEPEERKRILLSVIEGFSALEDELATTERLLRRHVERRAHHRAGARELILHAGLLNLVELRDSEVEDLHDRRAVLALMEEQILRLQITVHDAHRVRLVERARDLTEHARDFLRRQRPALRDDLLQIISGEELHHEERRAAELGRRVCVDDAHDVLALDARRRASLSLEALDRLRILRRRALQHLQRSAIARVHVLDEEHGAHAAFADLLQHAVSADDDLSRREHETVTLPEECYAAPR